MDLLLLRHMLPGKLCPRSHHGSVAPSMVRVNFKVVLNSNVFRGKVRATFAYEGWIGICLARNFGGIAHGWFARYATLVQGNVRPDMLLVRSFIAVSSAAAAVSGGIKCYLAKRFVVQRFQGWD